MSRTVVKLLAPSFVRISLSSFARLVVVALGLALTLAAPSAALAQPGKPAAAPPAPTSPDARPGKPEPAAKAKGKDGKDSQDGKDSKEGKDKSSDAEAQAQARAHFQRGQELANQGKYPQAYLEFEAGYRRSHRPLFLFNLGEAARAFGDAGRARAAYQRYLEEDPSGPMVSSAQARLAELGPGATTDLGLSRKDDPSNQPAKPTPLVGPLSLPPERFARSEPPPESRPMWKKWPFWAAVGGVVAGGAAVFVLTRDTSACGDGCTLVDLR